MRGVVVEVTMGRRGGRGEENRGFRWSTYQKSLGVPSQTNGVSMAATISSQKHGEKFSAGTEAKTSCRF